MRIFLTGATGFVGTALMPELINAGHTVTGLARSDAGMAAVRAAGATPHRGDLEDLASLERGAADADAVIHCGFVHDFTRFKEVCDLDRRVIDALGAALGPGRPLLITSGTGMGTAIPGQAATEDHFDAHHPNPRAASEIAGAAVSARGIDVRVIRLPQVHDPVKQGLITYLVALAREKGVSAHVGDGKNRWAAVHRSAAARVYRLALEKGAPGARYHAVAETGVPLSAIAAAIGKALNVPVVSKPPAEAAAHFGWLAMFAGMDMPASSALTQERLHWKPSGPGLIEDLEHLRPA